MIPADAGQIEEQKELLRQAMNQGAIGMSRCVVGALACGWSLPQWSDLYARDVRLELGACELVHSVE